VTSEPHKGVGEKEKELRFLGGVFCMPSNVRGEMLKLQAKVGVRGGSGGWGH